MKIVSNIFRIFKRPNHTSPRIKFDSCVCCGKTTEYPSDMPIAQRKYYVQGSGQLCEMCFDEICMDETEDKLSDDELKRLI